MQIMYRAEFGRYSGPRITVVEVERETVASVFTEGGTRHARVSPHVIHFRTFEEAKQHLVNVYTQRHKAAQTSLELALSYLGNAKGLKETN